MKVRNLHPWPKSVREAKTIQNKLRMKIMKRGRLKRIKYIAGCDISFEIKGKHLFAGVVVLDAKTLTVIEEKWHISPVTFPYVPGYLAFREIPALLEVFKKIKTTPDVIMCDGQGIAHPKRMGEATHLGILLDVPTIGCGKSKLCGEHEAVPRRKGRWVPLRDGKEILGRVVRTRAGIKPMYISIGHKISLDVATKLVLKTCRYRIPEPTRLAHQLVNRIRRIRKVY